MHIAHCSPQKRLGHMGSVHASVFTPVCHSVLRKLFKTAFCLHSSLPHFLPLTQTRIFCPRFEDFPALTKFVYCILLASGGKKKKPRSQSHWVQAKSSRKQPSSDIDDHHFLPLGSTITFMGPHISSVEMQQKYKNRCLKSCKSQKYGKCEWQNRLWDWNCFLGPK